MPEAFAINTAPRIVLEDKERPFGSLTLPPGDYVVIARVSLELGPMQRANNPAGAEDAWANLSLVAIDPTARARGIHDTDEVTVRLQANVIEMNVAQDVTTDARETAVLTLATHLREGGNIEAAATGRNVSAQARITAIQVDAVHLT